MQYWNEAALLGAAAPLPNVMELISLMDMCQWGLLPLLPNWYLLPAPTALAPSLLEPLEPPPCHCPHQEEEGQGTLAMSNSTPNHPLVHRWHQANKCLHSITDDNAAILPKSDSGQQLCLAFHLCGQCNHNCHHSNMHHTLMATEVERISCFLDTVGIPALTTES